MNIFLAINNQETNIRIALNFTFSNSRKNKLNINLIKAIEQHKAIRPDVSN